MIASAGTVALIYRARIAVVAFRGYVGTGSSRAGVNRTGQPVVTIKRCVGATGKWIAGVGGAGVGVVTVHVVGTDTAGASVNRAGVAVIAIERIMQAAGNVVTHVRRAWITVVAIGHMNTGTVLATVDGAGVSVVAVEWRVEAAGDGVAGIRGAGVAVIAVPHVSTHAAGATVGRAGIAVVAGDFRERARFGVARINGAVVGVVAISVCHARLCERRQGIHGVDPAITERRIEPGGPQVHRAGSDRVAHLRRR